MRHQLKFREPFNFSWVTSRDYNLGKYPEAHNKMELKVAHRLLDMGCKGVVFEYPLVLFKTKLKLKDGEESVCWRPKFISDVIGLFGTENPLIHELWCVECETFLDHRSGYLRSRWGSKVLGFLKSIQGKCRIKVFYFNKKEELKEIWNNFA